MTDLGLVGTVEACAILGIDRATLGRWADERLRPEERKIVPAMQLPGPNGAKLYRRADVEALAAELQAARSA